MELQQVLDRMREGILERLEGLSPTLYLCGSLTAGDFHPGWSDIDILVLTAETIPEDRAERLLNLRQELVASWEEPLFRAFEGGMLSLGAFLGDRRDRVVYWGTSGQRIRGDYDFNSLSMIQLLDGGALWAGREVRERMRRPERSEMVQDIRAHLDGIREHGDAGRSLYSYGWLLDIARCLYTLRTGKIIAKTVAGEWALAEGLCPDRAALERALAARLNPEKALKSAEAMDYAERLNPTVQRFADVLEAALAEEVGA